jgi:hypothetical protein
MPKIQVDRLSLAAVICVVFVAIALQIISIFRQSFTADEPYFLFSGYRALRYGQNTLNLEHPPLVAMLATVPLVHLDTVADNPYQFVFQNPSQALWIRFSSRFVLLLTVAIPFLWSCFLLGRAVVGTHAGVILMLAMALSFNVLPYLTIIQTDAAVGLGYILTLIAVIRFLRLPSLQRSIEIGLGFGLALSAKFSGVLLLPTILATLLAARHPSLHWKKRLFFLCVIIGLSGACLHLTYRVANWNYDPLAGREAISRYCQNQGTLIVDDHMRAYEELLLSIESFAPMEAQWLTGVLGVATQNRIGVYASHAFGRISSRGRWWFFPVLFLIRTPIALLLACVGAFYIAVSHRESIGRASLADPTNRRIFLVFFVTFVVYLGTAVFSTYNLGIRHLLPVLPMLLLPAAAWAARQLACSCALIGVLLMEALLLCPLWMTATNTWWLGGYNPTHCAVISDCEYKQNFLTLAAAARKRGIHHLHVAFPLFTELEQKVLLPDAITVNPQLPLQPGWHAVSVYIEQFLPTVLQTSPEEIHHYDMFATIAETWKPYLAEIRRQGIEHGYSAGSFHLYYVP